MKHSNPYLEHSDCVSITFEWQKKDERNDTVTQRATRDAPFSPVWIWAALVKRIWSYPGASDDTPVSVIWKDGRIQHVTSEIMINALRAAVIAIGEDALDFKYLDDREQRWPCTWASARSTPS